MAAGGELGHGERGVATAPVGDDVADCQAQKGRVEVAQGQAPRRHDAFEPTGQVPAASPPAELHEPRPHVGGRCGQRERAVHHDDRVGHQLVARQGRGALAPARPHEHLVEPHKHLVEPPAHGLSGLRR
ncbi:hypothetical protein ACFUC1_04410 [Pedococcus sp. NPDC057267]|uniref:hypothetical protein n=1 Tax=Pedococcus sp. NPDC057267 TaxID=3346077 RepID=UPI003633842E